MQYAREHHFPNPTFFVDDGVSGVTYDRPGFQAMLAEIEAGRVAVAIAKDLSRLGRNSALTGLYTNFTFPQNGVRFIAINDNYDTIDPNRVDNDFAGIKNWFNEFYARDTSRKIRAVQKAKGERGVPLTTNVPYGYVKDLENPRRWVVDPVAADVVKRIFDLCMKGRGPMQIANQLKADKVLTPSAYRALQGIKTPNKKPEDPCDWHSSTVVAILERREYTGCTVNFKTYTNSIWDKKQRDNPLEKQAIFPNTHEAIIEEAVFEKVQQVRQQRHRKTRKEVIGHGTDQLLYLAGKDGGLVSDDLVDIAVFQDPGIERITLACDTVVEGNDTLLEALYHRQIRMAAAQLQDIDGKAANVNDIGDGMSFQRAELGNGSRKCLGIAEYLADPDRVVLSVILKIHDLASAQEVLLETAVQLLIVCGRQTHKQGSP